MELSSVILLVLPFVTVLFFGWRMLRWQFTKADEMLERWAKDNHYRIMERQRANFGDGPTGTRQSSKRVKYRITVIDEKSQKKRGVISFGSKTMGTLEDEVGIEWE